MKIGINERTSDERVHDDLQEQPGDREGRDKVPLRQSTTKRL
jgi:hypothetical protein